LTTDSRDGMVGPSP